VVHRHRPKGAKGAPPGLDDFFGGRGDSGETEHGSESEAEKQMMANHTSSPPDQTPPTGRSFSVGLRLVAQ
jgi:hypothetical protein